MAEVEDIAAELQDCYGPLPSEAANLLELVRSKVFLRQWGIKKLDMTNGLISISFVDGSRVDQDRLLAKVLKNPQRYRLTPDNQIRITFPAEGEPLARLKKCLQELQDFVKGGDKAMAT